MGYTRDDWSQHYADARDFRRLGDQEKTLLAEHVPTPDNWRALDVCCGTGELAAYLASLGYTVDAADFADGALERARTHHAEATGVRWLCLDIEHDDLAELDEDGYDLITIRLAIAFIHDRARVLRRLAARLRDNGTLVVITPTADHTPDERRHIALGEDELAALTDGFTKAERFDTEGLAVLLLGRAEGSFSTEEKRRPDPQAVFGAAVVATDSFGRILLGRSRRDMWELPGGRVETGESATAAAVRELAEETGLTARVQDACVITVLHDDRLDVRRITAAVRVTSWNGELGLPEPHRFVRWEWHDLHTLPTLGKIFTPSAHTLDAVWPGALPGLPPVHSYPCADTAPPVPGEPPEASRLRARMADTVIGKGWAPSPRLQTALHQVPRHRFMPEIPLETAYHDDLAVVTVREADTSAVSSVSAAWLQADMIEQLQLETGMTVLEVGSGGYNAELLAHVLGPHGRVITVDLDPYVVHRTTRLCAEAGSGRVTPVLGDGCLGAPAHVPAGGFDGIVITHNTADIAPAWRQQLADGARLVVPLEIGGYTRSITLTRRGDTLQAEHFTFCGFLRDRGAAARTAPAVELAGGEVTVRWEDGVPGNVSGLEEALRGPRLETGTEVVLPGHTSFETLQVYAATTLPGFCRLAAPESSQLVSQRDAAAIVADGSLAYLACIQIHKAATPADSRWEFFIHAYGPAAQDLAACFTACVRDWDRHVRKTGYPSLTAHPAGTPDQQLPPGDVLDKPASRLVFQWPGRTP